MRRTLRGVGLVVALATSPAVAGGGGGVAELRDLVRDRTGVALPVSDNGATPGAAEAVDGLLEGPLTEARAVRVALLNNRRLHAMFEQVGVARADFRQALLPQNPHVEAAVRYGGGHRPGELAVMQDLSSLVLTPLRRRAAGSALEGATKMAAHAALEVVLETRSAFYELQAARQLQRELEQIVESARAAADLAGRQREAGNIPDLELENRQALYEQERIELARSQSEVLAAREHLNRLMGVWGDRTAWEVVDELEDVPADTASLGGSEADAMVSRLDLAGSEAEVRAIARSVSLARWSRFPELRVGIHVERESEGARTTGPAVELAFPLFDRGQHAVARARAELRQAEDRHAALAVEIRSEVRVARERLAAARELAAYYREVVVPRRARIVEQTQLEYNFMLTGVYQLLQVKQDEIRARREAIEARRDYWIARARFEHALGGASSAAGAN